MKLAYAPADLAFRDAVRGFLAAHAASWPKRSESMRPSPAQIAWQKLLISKGYAARTVPEVYGGHGAEPDLIKSRIIAEAFAEAGAPGSLQNQGISMLVPTLLELGTEAQKRLYIPPTLTGELVWCQGYSEPGAGSDLAALACRGEDVGDHFRINGQKIWTSSAHVADMMFCLVRTEADAPKHAGISYLIFSMQTPGIEVRPLKTMTGQAEFNEVFFTDVMVPKDQIVGERGQGWFVANATLKHERGMLGDPNAAAARLRAIIAILQRETVDGESLINNPLYLDRLMRLQARVLAMEANGLRLLTAAQKGEPAGLSNLIVKLMGCELNHQLAGLAIDALGELGVLYHGGPHEVDHGIWQHRYMFDLGLIIGGGTAQIQKNIIAERGLNLPREPKLAKPEAVGP